MKAENEARILGDPEIVWSFAVCICLTEICPHSAEHNDFCRKDYLVSSHHDRGIMTAAIQIVIVNWMIPRMAVHHICHCDKG